MTYTPTLEQVGASTLEQVESQTEELYVTRDKKKGSVSAMPQKHGKAVKMAIAQCPKD